MAGENVTILRPEEMPEPLAIAKELGKPVRLKTWSLIVTFFGDAILPRGGSVSAVTLAEVFVRFGIEAGAVRTAVSRLAADGWIERQREGRASYYRLAGFREQAFAAAERRIYKAPVEAARAEGWALGSLPADIEPDPLPPGMIQLQKGWYLISPELERKPEGMMVFSGRFEQKPAWFLEKIAPQAKAEAMERLIEIFAPVADALYRGWQPEPLDALALRCLLIHDWRRIVLRLNDLPKSVLPDDWPESRCRELVASIYPGLLDASECWLTANAHNEDGLLPPAGDLLAHRFTKKNPV